MLKFKRIRGIVVKYNNTINIVEILQIKYSVHQFNSLINILIDKMIEPIILMYNKYKTKN